MTTYNYQPFIGTERALRHLDAGKFITNEWAASPLDTAFFSKLMFDEISRCHLLADNLMAEEPSLLARCALSSSWEEEAAHCLMVIARLCLHAPEAWLMLISMADDVARHILEGRAQESMTLAWASLRLMHKRSAGVQRSWKFALECITEGFPQLAVPKKDEQD